MRPTATRALQGLGRSGGMVAGRLGTAPDRLRRPGTASLALLAGATLAAGVLTPVSPREATPGLTPQRLTTSVESDRPNRWAMGVLTPAVNSWALPLLGQAAPGVLAPPVVPEPAASTTVLPVIDTRVDASGIPARVLAAYRAAADRLAKELPSCRVRWELIAAIGRVESGHGTYGGAGVSADGRITPEIIGLRLDGAGPRGDP